MSDNVTFVNYIAVLLISLRLPANKPGPTVLACLSNGMLEIGLITISRPSASGPTVLRIPCSCSSASFEDKDAHHACAVKHNDDIFLSDLGECGSNGDSATWCHTLLMTLPQIQSWPSRETAAEECKPADTDLMPCGNLNTS